MCLLLESIKIQNRNPQNLEGHNRRLNNSRSQLFGLADLIDLRDEIKIPMDITEGICRCRVIYKEKIHSIEFEQYRPRDIHSLRLVIGNNIEYRHKYLDRSQIDSLKNNCGADDILIVRNNRITDASFANIVLYDGNSWVTPAYPLLRGTKRQFLIDSKIIREEDIVVKDLKHFQNIALINAMLDFNSRLIIPMQNILPLQHKK